MSRFSRYLLNLSIAGLGLVWLPTASGTEAFFLDQDVYLRAASDFLAGKNIYISEGYPWIYPPFAVLPFVPLTLVPPWLAKALWTVLQVALLLHLIARLIGGDQRRAAWLTAATLAYVEPVMSTILFGQLGIVLLALVMLDLVTWKVAGWGTGLATAIKLTPGVAAFYALLAGRWRWTALAFATFCAATLLSALVAPDLLMFYLGRLRGGESGMNHAFHYLLNQSVTGSWVRLVGAAGLWSLVASAGVFALGLAAAWRLARCGKFELGLVASGLAGLAASPISWTHHFTWIVPFAILILDAELAPWLRRLGVAIAGWVGFAPFKLMSFDHDVELHYAWWQNAIASTGLVLVVAWFAAVLISKRPVLVAST